MHGQDLQNEQQGAGVAIRERKTGIVQSNEMRDTLMSVERGHVALIDHLEEEGQLVQRSVGSRGGRAALENGGIMGLGQNGTDVVGFVHREGCIAAGTQGLGQVPLRPQACQQRLAQLRLRCHAARPWSVASIMRERAG